MLNYIGLVDVYDENKIIENRGIQVLCDTTMTSEFDTKQNRLICSVDLADYHNRDTIYKANKAIWDTGSAISCISERLAKKMNLKPDDIGIGITASGQKEVPYYRLDVYLSDKIVFKDLKVICFPLQNHDVDFLIGMDIISQGNLIISNENNKTCVRFDYLADK